MASSLGIYVTLWRQRRLAGAGTVAFGIALTLAAAVVQASSLRAHLVWEFDHNGLFHLVQLVAIVIVARGVRYGFDRGDRDDRRGEQVVHPRY